METTERVPALTLKSLMNRDEVRNKFQEMLGKRANQFITSVLQITASDDKLAKADPISIYNAAATAATLDLPLNNNLGFAYIIPYATEGEESYQDDKGKMQVRRAKKYVAQFQMGYKGFKQLALRTGQFEAINQSDVREGELKERNRLTGKCTFEWIQDETERLSKKVVGYVSYFRLHNGFSQTLYMTVEELTAHGMKYSQTMKKKYGRWVEDYNGMCLKTVIKLNLSKNAPLSIDMQMAQIVDQSVIKNPETLDVEYVDNDAKIEKPTIEDLQLLLDSKRAQATKEDIEDMERCISGKEEKSYKKFFDYWSNL